MRFRWVLPLACAPLFWVSTTLLAAPTGCPQVFRIDAFDGRGQHLRTATAFAAPNGDGLLTVAHAVRDAARIEALGGDGQRFKLRAVSFAAAPTDLAVLHLPPRATLNAATPATADISLGQPIRALAHTVDLGFIEVRGVIVAVLQHPLFGEVISISAPLIEGMSGAAIVDEQCRLLGIASFGVEGREHRYYAIPAAAIAALPRRQ